MAFTFQTGGGKYQDGMYASFTATVAGTILTVSAMLTGSQPIVVGQQIIGGTVINNATTYYIANFGTGTGGIGTYNLNAVATNATVVNYTTSYVFNGGKVVMNSIGKSLSFDTTTKSQSYTLGYIQCDVQLTTSNSNIFNQHFICNLHQKQ